MRIPRPWLAPLLLVCGALGHAVPANPDPRTVTQPDGSVLTIHQKGDELHNWLELGETGLTVVKNPATGSWEYAEASRSGELVPSGIRAVSSADNVPAHLPKHARPLRNPEMEASLRGMLQESLRGRTRTDAAKGSAAATSLSSPWEPVPVSGQKKLLLIRINFHGTPLVTPASGWHTKTFDATAKSVSRYFADHSYGMLSVLPASHTQAGSPAGVITVTIGDAHPNTASYYQFSQDQTIGNHALEQAAAFIDFDGLDADGDGELDTSELMIYFIWSGYEASAGSGSTPSAWAHAWWTSGTGLRAGTKNVRRWALNGERYSHSTPMGMGVIAHELGHQMCGLPDLYDTSTSDANGAMGYFSLMASGSWGGDVGETGGYTPTGLDVWSRQYLGWATPVSPAPGWVDFPSPLSSPTASAILVDPGMGGTEYFLAENRGPVGWDLGFRRLGTFGPGWAGGLLLLHVDTTVGTPGSNDINRSQAHGGRQGVVPVQASTAFCDMLATASRGHATTLFYSGNNADWDEGTTPDSRYYDGTPSGLRLTSISAPSATMSALYHFAQTGPAIGSFSPSEGPVGRVVTIAGSGLAGATAVRFNGALAPILGTSAGSITTAVPAGATTGRITVTTPLGTATSAGDFAVNDDFLINGDFELGDDHWTWASTEGGAAELFWSDPGFAHGGNRLAWFGGWGVTNTASIHQAIAIPATASTVSLEYWVAIGTAETGPLAGDTFSLQIRSTGGSVLATPRSYSNLSAASFSTYTKQTVDLSSYKGSTIQIRFASSEDADLLTGFLLDDVALRVTVPVKSRDLDGDGVVDVRDMARLATAYGKVAADSDWSSHATADLNEDDRVDDEDISLLLSAI